MALESEYLDSQVKYFIFWAFDFGKMKNSSFFIHKIKSKLSNSSVCFKIKGHNPSKILVTVSGSKWTAQ
jgi:hypothetical protein